MWHHNQHYPVARSRRPAENTLSSPARAPREIVDALLHIATSCRDAKFQVAGPAELVARVCRDTWSCSQLRYRRRRHAARSDDLELSMPDWRAVVYPHYVPPRKGGSASKKLVARSDTKGTAQARTSWREGWEQPVEALEDIVGAMRGDVPDEGLSNLDRRRFARDFSYRRLITVSSVPGLILPRRSVGQA